MHILVTGASGIVGSQVVRELQKHGHFVHASDNRVLPEDLRALPNVVPLYCDLTDPLSLLNNFGGIDAIAHCGAIPNPLHHPNAELLQVNVVGTQNVLDAAQAHGISKVIITSSIGALGYSYPVRPIYPEYLPIDAKHPRLPHDVYGLSKVMNEESAASWTRNTGKTTIVLRPPAVMNLERAKQHGWLARGVERSGEKFSQDIWAYIDSRDLAVCFRRALETELTGHHVFYAIADDVFSRLTAQELIARHLPDLVRYADNLTGNSLYDLTPARDILGFTAEHTWQKVLDAE